QARGDLPVVLDAPEAAELALLEDLVDEVTVEPALLVVRDDVAILRRAAEAPPLVGGQGGRGVLAVRDRPEERDLREESLLGGGAELRREKAGLSLAADGRREGRKVGDDRHRLGPEGRVPAVDEILEVRRGLAQVERPRRRLVLARREHALADAIDALAQTLQTLAREAVVGRGVQLALIDDAGAGLDVVLDPLAGQPIVAIVEDRAP